MRFSKTVANKKEDTQTLIIFLNSSSVMNLVVVMVMLAILALSFFWSSAPTEARLEPFLSPVSDPVLPIEIEPVSPIPSQIAPQSPEGPVVRLVHRQDKIKKIVMALIISSSILGGILLSLLCFWVYRKSNLKNSDMKSKQIRDSDKGNSPAPILGKFNSSRTSAKKCCVASMDYRLLVAATNDFHKDNLLDESGFGCVYKARFNNNLLAAVKRVHSGPLDAEREFENEMNWLSKLHHQNIVSLLGYCVQDDSRFLVYEMMHNGSLESHLRGPSLGSNLTWHLRMKIALGVARGLEFLHERCNPPVIHRDLKSSSILLDSQFNAKLSDFGKAVASGNRNKDNSKLLGTLGYIAPEYVLDGKLTDKSDVYAFGVILLELLMGRKPREKATPAQQQSIVTWAMPQLSNRSKLPNFVDPAIRDTMDLKHLYQVAAITVLCVQSEPSYRPLITDVLHSFIPLVPHELGGSLRVSESMAPARS